MSLTIFQSKEEVPKEIKYVKYNDLFFEGEIINDDPVSKAILKEVEQAEYAGRNYFIGRVKEDGNINKSNLSTGTKTLLNIINHPDICFDTLECGDNALFALRRIKEGYAVDKYGVALITDDALDCDIIYHKKHFTNFADYVKYREEELSYGN